MDRESTGIFLVLVSAVSFGLMPIFARFAYAQGVRVDELLFVRFLLAFLIMGTILTARRQLTIPQVRELLVLLVLGGLLYFLDSAFYFTSLLYSPVAIVELVLYTYPAFVTVGAFALGWERITRRLVAAIFIAMVGLLLVANPFGNPIGFGVLLALGSSITYTIYILGGTRVLRRVREDLAAFYVMGAATVSFGLTGTLNGSIRLNWSFEGWFWVAMIALLCTVIALTSFFVGISRIGPSRAALISLVEPVASVLVATEIFGNALNGSQWLGGVLILAATALTTIYGKPESRISS